MVEIDVKLSNNNECLQFNDNHQTDALGDFSRHDLLARTVICDEIG